MTKVPFRTNTQKYKLLIFFTLAFQQTKGLKIEKRGIDHRPDLYISPRIPYTHDPRTRNALRQSNCFIFEIPFVLYWKGRNLRQPQSAQSSIFPRREERCLSLAATGKECVTHSIDIDGSICIAFRGKKKKNKVLQMHALFTEYEGLSITTGKRDIKGKKKKIM